MHTGIRAVLAAAAASCLVVQAAAAQTTSPQPAPAPDAAPQSPAAPAPAAQAPAAAGGPAADAPIVGWTENKQPPSFVLMTAGHAMFAAVGAVAAVAEGRETAKHYEFQDSANLVTPELAKAWAVAHGDRLASEATPIDSEHKNIVKTATKEVADLKGASFIVDGASSTSAIYFSFDWTHYGLIYSLQVRVVDTASGKVVAKARCFRKPEKTPESPTHDQMFADNAAVLKKMMADNAQACLPKLMEDLKLSAGGGSAPAEAKSSS